MFKFDLQKGEKLLKIFRRTELALAKPAAVIFLLIYLPWAFLFRYELAATYKNYMLVWTLAVAVYGINKYLLWQLSATLLTDKRIVSISYQNLFARKVTDIPLASVVQSSHSTTGLMSSLLNFGDVEISLKGSDSPVLIKSISQPRLLYEEIKARSEKLPA